MASVFSLPQTREHVPLRGQDAAVEVALLPKNIRTAPVDQLLYIGGYLGTYEIVSVTAASSYVAVVGSLTYTVVAGATDTPKSVAYKLIDLINGGTSTHGATAQIPRNVTGDDWIFDVYHPSVTFTLAKTGTTTPADVTVVAVTGNTTAIAKGATSITVLNALIGDIQANQYLQAVDNFGIEYLIKLTATAVAGATSLSVAALNTAIPAASQIGFIPELFDRTEMSNSAKADKADYATNSTHGKVDAIVTKTTYEGKISGLFFEADPAYQTILFAFPNGREVWIRISDPVFRDGWSRRTIEGPALILSLDKPRKLDGFITNDFSFQFLPGFVEREPAPLY